MKFIFQKNFHGKGLGALDVQEGTTFENIFSLNKQDTQKYIGMLL